MYSGLEVPISVSTVVLMVVLGTLLSASAGLRAFLAPFGLACAQGMGWVQLAPELHWIGSPLAIGTFGLAIVIEVLSDKVPLVHHALDVVHIGVKPVAGALAGAALVGGNAPLMTWVLAIIGGGAVAGAAHFTKAGLRVGSTAVSVGTAAPAHSLAEDAVAVVAALAGMAGMALAQ